MEYAKAITLKSGTYIFKTFSLKIHTKHFTFNIYMQFYIIFLKIPFFSPKYICNTRKDSDNYYKFRNFFSTTFFKRNAF